MLKSYVISLFVNYYDASVSFYCERSSKKSDGESKIDTSEQRIFLKANFLFSKRGESYCCIGEKQKEIALFQVVV